MEPNARENRDRWRTRTEKSHGREASLSLLRSIAAEKNLVRQIGATVVTRLPCEHE